MERRGEHRGPEKVAALYAPAPVLLPTLSPQIRTTQDEIVDYFGHFLARKPSGKLRSIVKVLDNRSAIDTGPGSPSRTRTAPR